jgi:hypothetical protein
MSYDCRVRIAVSADAFVFGDPAPIVHVLERELGVPSDRA